MSDAERPPDVELPPGWRPEWAPPKRALEEARRRAASEARKADVSTRDDVLTGLSQEAVDDTSPAAARVSALRALAELLPPDKPEGDGYDTSVLSPEQLDQLLYLISLCRPKGP